MLEVVSLVGTSYTGKSRLAEAVVPRLASIGIGADIIKKDDAVEAFGRERFGDDDTTGGYSLFGLFRHGAVPQHELHAWMNERVRASLEVGRVAILEGGTRTRSAQAETLADIELDPDGLRIFRLELPLKETLVRAHKRRKEANRYDDRFPIALAKLCSQYRGIRSDDAPKLDDADVTPLDASMTTAAMAELVTDEIVRSRG